MDGDEARRRLRPPDDVVGVPADLGSAVLARTGDMLLSLGDFVVYPTGFVFSVHIKATTVVPSPTDDPPTSGKTTPGPGYLRLELEFADGIHLANHRSHIVRSDHGIWMQACGGTTDHFSLRYWVWPLPSGRSWSLRVAWPRERIDASVELPVEPIRKAAASLRRPGQ